jgi:hypothetical protein
MNYDYTFFREHLARKRKMRSLNGAIVESGVGRFFGYPIAKEYLVLEPKIDESTKEGYVIAHSNGAYLRGPSSALDKLEDAMRCKLPEDFVQFHREFGEALVITRTDPLWLWDEEKMIQEFRDDFERDLDEEFPEGRFFRFASYPTEHRLLYGLRKHDQTDLWEIARPNLGDFYEEIIAPEGREHYVAASFYDWLKNFIERDGYPDFYSPDEDHFYSQSLD